jgi:NitT/TauT family transport system substrate-binding protein
MPRSTRRRFLHGLAAASLLTTRVKATQPTPLRMLLNSDYSSVNAWFSLAVDRGYLREGGLDLAFTAGRGAYTAAGRMVEEGFDVGYGDVNALVEVAANAPATAPIAVYMMFPASPSVIAVAADSPIHAPQDLAGRHLRGHATDVALQTFPALAAKTGLSADAVRITTSEAGMGALAGAMLKGDTDGLFGYESTITAALITAGIPTSRIRFLFYRQLVPELYGSALMVSRRLTADRPALVRALVRAVNRGVRDVMASEDAAIAATRARLPSLHEGAERERLRRTLTGEMTHPDVATRGLGGIDPVRFGRSLELLAKAKGLPRVPAVAEVFSTAFAVPGRSG